MIQRLGSGSSTGFYVRVFAGLCMVGTIVLPFNRVSAQQPDATAQCRPAGALVTIPELPEASGVAVSRRIPGRLWSHNDSGQPILIALDAHGRVTGQLRITGATVDDWEAVAVGACPGGSCVYVGDIGDNGARRKRITIYRFPEPAETDTAAAATDAFHATYPDGAHDAEALLVMPDQTIFIVTKGDTGAVALYRFPRDLRPGASHQLERVGNARTDTSDQKERITDGAVSPDGQWVALRTSHRLTFYRTAELTKGHWQVARTVDLKNLGEAQGEGVGFGSGGWVYLVGEGGGKGRPGTFARLTCSPTS